MKKFFARVQNRFRILFAYFYINVRRFIIEARRNPKSNIKHAEFCTDGFLKFVPEKMQGLTDFLMPQVQDFMVNQNNDLFKVIEKNKFGIKSIAVNLNADFLFRYILNRDLYDLLHAYYGKNFYLRNNPTIEFSYTGEANDAQKFHLDWGLRQISVMVNLNDLTEGSTHMTYLSKSNRAYYFKGPERESKKAKLEVERHIRNHPDCAMSTIGPRHTTSVFDAGNGYHRQVAGTDRVMLHFNFVENFAFSDWKGDWLPRPLPGSDYWFSKFEAETAKLIAQSGMPQEVFSLVFQRHHPELGVPKIYSANSF